MPRYSDEFKAEALELLERNGGNVSGTMAPAARSFSRAYPSFGSAYFCFLGGDFKLILS